MCLRKTNTIIYVNHKLEIYDKPGLENSNIKCDNIKNHNKSKKT